MPFLLTQVMASNIGGAATLIGDPPNILIGSAADLSFLDFVFALTPVVLLTLPAVLGVLYLMFRKDLSSSKDAEETIGAMDAAASIRDPILLRKSLIVLGLVIVAFFLHGALHLEAATIALFGAAALMLYARSDVEEVLREVEWPTLIFFVGLFVLVGGLEATGFVGSIATALTNVAGGTSALTAIVVIWGSGIASGHRGQHPFHGDHDPGHTGPRRRRRGSRRRRCAPCGGLSRSARTSAATSPSSAPRPTSSSPA